MVHFPSFWINLFQWSYSWKFWWKTMLFWKKMTQSPDILAACDLLQWGSGLYPIKIFKNYVKWCSFLPSEFIYSTEVILENLDKKQCFLGENIQKPWYTNSLQPASMGVWGVTPGNFQNLEAKWCIFLHSECIYSTKFIFENLDENCFLAKNNQRPYSPVSKGVCMSLTGLLPTHPQKLVFSWCLTQWLLH